MRALENNLDAKLKWVELQKKLGSLLDRDLVSAAIESPYRVHRDAILNLPFRLAGQLADLTEIAEIEQLIEHELRTALEDLAVSLARVAQEGPNN